MNKKFIVFSSLSLGILIATLSGCDWCSCCKKDSSDSKKTAQSAAQPKVMPTDPHETMEPKKNISEPKMMLNHPEQEEQETPMVEPIPKIAIPMAEPKMTLPVEPTPVAPMPIEPKTV